MKNLVDKSEDFNQLEEQKESSILKVFCKILLELVVSGGWDERL